MMNQDERNAFVDLALAMYVGERCTICGEEFSSVEDIRAKSPVRSSQMDQPLELACKKCWHEKEPSC